MKDKIKRDINNSERRKEKAKKESDGEKEKGMKAETQNAANKKTRKRGEQTEK